MILNDELRQNGLLLASNNKNKLHEFRRVLEPYKIDVKCLADLGIELDVEETAPDFAGNAAIKAREGFRLSQKPCIADDSGLCVEALGGEPGVYSARYGNENWSDQDRLVFLLKNLEKTGSQNRKACFQCVIALCYGPDDSQIHYYSGSVEGEITKRIQGTNGFGYDPVFKEAGSDLTFAELPAEQKDAISHRGRALQKFLESLS